MDNGTNDGVGNTTSAVWLGDEIVRRANRSTRDILILGNRIIHIDGLLGGGGGEQRLRFLWSVAWCTDWIDDLGLRVLKRLL